MKIGIDCRLWNQTGVGRYTRNLVHHLLKIDKKNEYFLFFRSEDAGENQIKNPKVKIQIADFSWHSLDEQIEFPRLLNKYNLDLVHFPYFSVPFFYRKPYVVTIHDLIVNKFNTGKASTLPFFLYQVKRLGYRFIIANALKSSQKIIVPSKTVRKDIVKEYKVPEAKIAVTYEGGFENISELKAKDREIPKNYFLRVGNFYPHKNIDTLLLAFAQFLKTKKDFKLVLVGKKDFFYKRINDQIESLGLSKSVMFVENPPDDKIFSLYKNAVATVVPSFMEGFSLTAVEAMSSDSPLIASDIPVHREICGDGAIYFDPNSQEALALIMELITKDSKTRAELIEKGKEKAKAYSWEKMTRETLKVYESSLSLRQS
jgi:glycosyltransferase involved in cell wall biosynthesis